MSRSFTIDEVKSHNNEKDGVWIIIQGGVYDVTSFLDDHPGGKKILLRSSGKDSSVEFWKFHNKSILEKAGAKFKIGNIGTLNTIDKVESDEEVEEEDDEYFGDLIPFGDPYWYQGWSSPYYKDSHKKVRKFMRNFVETELMPYAYEWDEAKHIPEEVYKKVAMAGILAASTGHWPSGYDGGVKPPGGVKVEEWDSFHGFIVVDELSRTGSGGILWGLVGGIGIGLPPIIRFGSDEMKQRVVPDCVKGEKRICLAITEPAVGSDVANLTTTAKKTSDGKFYIVNGEKKWITNGIYSDCNVPLPFLDMVITSPLDFTCAVRTGGKGLGGISLLLIEKKFPGVKTRKMDCSGVWASGTTFISFEDVKVPVENIIGKENKGFQLIMSNFNNERLGIAMQANRFARVCLEESIKYASKRKTFDTLLRDHPVIRNKLGQMARMVEATHASIEILVHQASEFSEEDLMIRGGGAIALVKSQATSTFEFCAREASQIFGGLSYSRGGQGEKIERLAREVRAYSVPGGSEEIMLDLGIRQSIKVAEIMGAKL